MTIVYSIEDMPLGVTPREAAALVLGAEAVAANKLWICIEHEGVERRRMDWARSMRERFANEPMPPDIEEDVVNIERDAGPPVSPQPVASLSAPADCRSVADAAPPLKHAPPDYRGLTLESMKSDAQRRGLQLTDTGNGFRLANKHGSLVRKTLAELVDFIRSADSGATRVAPQEEAAN